MILNKSKKKGSAIVADPFYFSLSLYSYICLRICVLRVVVECASAKLTGFILVRVLQN